jgi:Dolichyl-phosphate-mannose-protein mannosyltransferase
MELSPLSKTIPPRIACWSWALVVACGLLLGYYMLQTYGLPLQRQYQLGFGHAQWIEPVESYAPIAYFRKEVYLPAIPEQAWLEIAASDNFGLIINGHTLGNLNSVKTFETGIYDLKRALKLGTNVIAVSISRTSYPGTAQLLVRGQITEPGERVIPILSDETWRASNRTGIIGGEVEWTSPQVEDQVWPRARRSPLNDQHVPLRWVDTNPLLVKLPRIGSWIMPENAAHEVVFSTVIKADSAKQETWIQVASSGDLDLVVNGHIITAASSAATGGKKLPHLATAEATPTQTNDLGKMVNAAGAAPKVKGSPFVSALLEAYDISYWIKRGPNVIIATVRNDQIPASLFLNGFLVKNDGDVTRFATTSSWHLGDQPEAKQGTAKQRLIEIGKDGVAPWGYLPQELARPQDRSGFATLFRSWAIVGLTLIAVIAIWLIVSGIVSDWRREPLPCSLARDALLHGPIIAGLLLMLLPNYDPRFPDEWSFQPKLVVGAFAVLLLLRLLHLLPDSWVSATAHTALDRVRTMTPWESSKARLRRLISDTLRLPEFFEIPFCQLLPYLLLVLIMFLGLGLRYHNLGFMSFDHDEMGVITKSKGIYTLGIPYTTYAGEVRWMTTYEAIPYPLALSGLFFGYSEWSMRLPACIFGTLTIGVIGLMCRRLFDWRTGLFAAFVYACLPLNIRWAQNAFYLSQCQFLTILAMWLFYEAIRLRPFHRNFLTGAAVAFCFCYMSWEGTGFLLPAFFMGLLVVRWGEWWWLKEFHLYRCLFFMGAVVVAQYCSRMMAGAPYLQVGSGLSNLTGPSLFFLAPGYQPMFYVDKLLLSENHVFFTLMLVIGLPFCWKLPSFRYVVVLLGTLFTLHSNFLAALSPRYCYYFQPLVIIGGVAATVMLYDRILALARETGDSAVGRLAAHTTGIALLVLLFFQSNESIMKEYQLSSTGDTPEMMTRMGTYRYDYRGAAFFVKTHARPGDVILPGIPHVFNFYTGFPGDYFLDTLFASKVPYDQLMQEPGFIDKFAGLPVIRNITEFKDVIHRSRRAWIIFAPYASFEKLNSPEVVSYVHEHTKTEFESYRAKVFLFEGAQSGVGVTQTP